MVHFAALWMRGLAIPRCRRMLTCAASNLSLESMRYRGDLSHRAEDGLATARFDPGLRHEDGDSILQ